MPFKTALWILAAPIVLWPFALLLSPYIAESPALSALQANVVATLMWFYPIGIVLIIVLLRKLQSRSAKVAYWLAMAAIVFVYWHIFALAQLF
ncbi:DUF5389 family protein [Spirabiliibacterium falconis]|uniref:DUF5389 family protein n=1 Tax=Spirabiliibacterium falconis TaxID=572023 RepID=UPI001AADD96D|nr:DUF5389 family protein [Spirabiliibacterium falconis]MBE2894465.1 DUF5389 family protein [Spirabiliibacterium falconis]